MKRKFFLASGVIALTAAAVLSGCQQLQQPQVPPEQVVKEGMKKLTAVTSHEFEFGVKGDMTTQSDTGKPSKVQFDVTLGGAVDMKDTTDPKVDLKLDGSGSQDASSATGSAEFRMNKEALYFTLVKLDTKGGQPLPQEVTAYLGKWWKITIPPESLKQFTSSLPEGGASQESLTPEQQKMKTLFENTQFFKNIKFVAMEDVKGEQSYHYSADLDKDAFMKFATEAAVEQGKPMTDAETKDMQDSMKKVDFTGNVWVGATSGILNQITGDIKLTSTAATDPSGTVSVRLTLWNFNKPVTVQVPADAQEFPMQQLMQGLMGGAAGGIDTTGAGAGIPGSMDTSGAGAYGSVSNGGSTSGDTTGTAPSGDTGTTTPPSDSNATTPSPSGV